MTKFQLIVTGIFGVLIVVGVIIFSAYKGSSQNAASVVVWGTMPQTTFNKVIQATSLYQSKEIKVSYVEKTEEDFDADFIESLASGTGPDVFMLPSDKILKHGNKVFAIPYEAFTERQFKDAFIEGAEIYMAPGGILALPAFADPLVMYWNRSLFNQAKVTEPPKYWDELYELANAMSQKDGALNILKSAVAFGEFGNVSNAKDIIINLAMQAGTPVVQSSGNGLRAALADPMGKPVVPAEAAVNFYTEFSNPAKPSYSWNRSLPNSASYFLGGDLGLYFGFASEITGLQLKNPNLNFDVAEVPVSREGGVPVSLAKFNAFAITKSTKNPSAAFSVISILSGKEAGEAFAQNLRLAPVRRDILKKKPANSYESVFYGSAIRGKSWLDPSPVETAAIFKAMVESVTSGRSRTSEAVMRADKEISQLLSKYTVQTSE